MLREAGSFKAASVSTDSSVNFGWLIYKVLEVEFKISRKTLIICDNSKWRKA